jgi:hypothetical protein
LKSWQAEIDLSISVASKDGRVETTDESLFDPLHAASANAAAAMAVIDNLDVFIAPLDADGAARSRCGAAWRPVAKKESRRFAWTIDGPLECSRLVLSAVLDYVAWSAVSSQIKSDN